MAVDPTGLKLINLGPEPPSQGAGDNPDNLWDDGGGGSGGGGGGYFSYMDGNGNKWHHADPLAGTASAAMQYTEGDGWDGFGDTGNGFATGVKKGTRNGVEGYYVSYTGVGAAGDGHHLLQEVVIDNKFVALPSNNVEDGLEWGSHINDGIGGMGSGFGYSSSSFRLTNGAYNGSEFSFKYYSSGWNGGSRAAISTYEVAGLGEGVAKGALVVGVVLGGVKIYNGIQKDGGRYGQNAQLATGDAVGGLVGGWAGAETGATIGASIGVWCFGVGAAPGAIIGGIIGGWLGGWGGAEAGKATVEEIQ